MPMPHPFRSPDALLPMLGGALAAAGAVGAAWRLDAQRRARYARRLHRMQIQLLLNALSAGDPVTARHCRRVADLTDVLAHEYHLDREAHATLRVAALLHDMGKIDDDLFHIIHSCDSLTPEQRKQIERHPHESAHILEPLEGIHPGIQLTVESHHECWDGEGYPRGLRGDEIPLAARLISVADVFDALTQPRAYHEPLEVREALDQIREAAGQRFDPEVVCRLRDPVVLDRWRAIVHRGRISEAAQQAE